MSCERRSAEDFEAIRRLMADYGRLLDLRDAPGWAALFTPDGAWSGGERYGVIAARAALAAFIEREFASAAPCVHIFGAPAIAMRNDGASAWSRWMLVEQTGSGLRIALAGHYNDSLALTPEGWRFRRREVAVDLPAGA